MPAAKKPSAKPPVKKRPSAAQRRQDAQRKRVLELAPDAEIASDVEEKEIEWLMQDRIPMSMVTLVAGRPGQGKSLFSAWLAAEISQEHAVIFSNVEDLRRETSRPRLRIAGAKLENVHFWTPTLTTPHGIAQLEAFVTALKVKLLVIDPAAAHFPGRTFDDRTVVGMLTALCERTGLAVVALHHTKKGLSKNAHPLDAVKGNGDGFLAAARFVYIFGPNPDDVDERVLAGAKTNAAELGSMSFAMDVVETEIAGKKAERPRLVLADPKSSINAQRVLSYTGGDDNGGNPVKKAIAGEWLTSFLMFGERDTNAIRDEGTKCGLAWKTIGRAAKGIGATSERRKRPGFGTGFDTFWALPAGHPALKVGEAAMKALGTDVLDGTLTVEDVLALIDAQQTTNGGASNGAAGS